MGVALHMVFGGLLVTKETLLQAKVAKMGGGKFLWAL